MNAFQLILTQICSAAVIGVMLFICLRSRPAAPAGAGPRIYRIHPGWYVFCGLGGLFLVGTFAYASVTTIPENQKIAAWSSVISALFFAFLALVFRAAVVTLDATTLTSRTLVGERTVPISEIEGTKIVGLVVEVKFRSDPATGKTPKTLTFLAGFRGLGELLATVRARAGLPPKG